MTPEAWVVLGVVAAAFLLMAFTRIGPDMILTGGVVLLLTLSSLTPYRILSVEEALAGFSNEGMLTVAVLFVVAAGLRETGGMGWLIQRLIGRARSIAGAQARILFPVAAMSAFMNNTPLVAMLLPGISDWAKKRNLPASKFLLPLSYAAVLGGTCTLIGTSTNLVVSGLLSEERRLRSPGLPVLGLFDVAWIGVPCALIGLVYVLLASRWLLPDRRPVIEARYDPRKYSVEMLVQPGSSLVGNTIEDAGLRHLPGMYLVEIDREGEVLAAVSPQERLRANDRLVFVGIIDSVVDLQKLRGLTPATNQVFKLDSPRSQRCLIEAVVSDTCPLAGMTIRDGRFRNNYNAVVIAVSRNGERIQKKIGDIVLRPGDTLLLEAHPSFVKHHRNSPDFYLLSRIEDSHPPRHDRAWTATAILAAMVLAAGFGWLSMLNAALLAAAGMVLTHCTTGAMARRSIDLQVLLTIAAAFGLQRALERTGAARAISEELIGFAGNDPWLALAIVAGLAMAFTELITNTAAAALCFPIAVATAGSLGTSVLPFAMAVMMGSSYSFATPIGYQTHLMVFGPGGYRFGDYLRLGVPLNLILWAATVLLVPRIWAF
jgi:di/tricarboxylate transporter